MTTKKTKYEPWPFGFLSDWDSGYSHLEMVELRDKDGNRIYNDDPPPTAQPMSEKEVKAAYRRALAKTKRLAAAVRRSERAEAAKKARRK